MDNLPIALSKVLIICIAMLLIWLAFAMSGSAAGGTIGLIFAFIIGGLLFRLWVLRG